MLWGNRAWTPVLEAPVFRRGSCHYVPLLPLLALNVALPIGWLVEWGPSRLIRFWQQVRRPRLAAYGSRAVSWALALVCVAPMAYGYRSSAIGLERDSLGLWTISQTAGQRQAVDWIRRYLHPDSALLVDDEFWVALRESHGGQPVFNNAH